MCQKQVLTLCPVLFSFLNESVEDKLSIPKLRLLMQEEGQFDHLIITGPGCSGKSTLEQILKSVLALNLPGIKSKEDVQVRSVITDRSLPHLPPPYMNIHLDKELLGEDKDPDFLSILSWEIIDFAKWVLAEEL